MAVLTHRIICYGERDFCYLSGKSMGKTQSDPDPASDNHPYTAEVFAEKHGISKDAAEVILHTNGPVPLSMRGGSGCIHSFPTVARGKNEAAFAEASSFKSRR